VGPALTGDAVTVLFVEDSDADADLIGLALERAGRERGAVRARDPEEAMVLLDGLDEAPALVLVDIGLPGAGGIELLRDIRRRWGRAALPALVLSSSAEPRDVRAAYDAGASGYLVKPLRFGDLASSIDAAARFWIDQNRVIAPD